RSAATSCRRASTTCCTSTRVASTCAAPASASSMSSCATTTRSSRTAGRNMPASTRERYAPPGCPTGWRQLSGRLSRRLRRRRCGCRRSRGLPVLLRLLLRRSDADELRYRTVRRIPDVPVEQRAVRRVDVAGHAGRHGRYAVVVDDLLAGCERRIDRLLQRRHAVRDERARRADDPAVSRSPVE